MKKLTSVLICLFCVIAVLVSCKKPNENLKFARIQEIFSYDHFNSVGVIIGERKQLSDGMMTTDGQSYEDAHIFSELLCFDEWKSAKKTENEKLRFSVILSELYEIRFYNSYFEVYDGYAPMFTDMHAYYEITDNINKKIDAYLAEKDSE